MFRRIFATKIIPKPKTRRLASNKKRPDYYATETFSCGTGSTASLLVGTTDTSLNLCITDNYILLTKALPDIKQRPLNS